MSERGQTRPYATNARGEFEVSARGFDVLHLPQINKGTAFTNAERQALGLVGLLPPAVMTIEQQASRLYDMYRVLPNDLAKNSFLAALQDRNETLYFYVLAQHIVEMFPIVYTPTVGTAIQEYNRQYQRPRGVFLSIEHPELVEESLRNAGASASDIDLLVATDAEAILGIGDWGVGGIGICVGKLAVYTAAGGIDPARVIPVMLDVGTDNQSLLDDPLYLGYRHPRVRGASYRAFIDRYIQTAHRLFPNAVLHWEDFGAGNARWILDEYRTQVCTFNDDIQGTAGVVLAAILAALKVTGGRLRDQRIVIFGSGTAGMGIADLIRRAIALQGATEVEAARCFWCVDRNGLIVSDMPDVRDFQAPFARSREEVQDWARDGERGITLAEVVRRAHPTILIGTSGQSGAFHEEIVREMARGTPRPILLPLSNPTALAEGVPADIIPWSDGRALLATGSPFEPVLYNGVSYTIGQANNAIIFPGLGLGTIVTRARVISDAMFIAAATALAAMVDPANLGASILPPVSAIREVSKTVAVAVGQEAAREGLVREPIADLRRAVDEAAWEPRYRPIRAV
ncbi:MAG: NAD-dependent malic enzyme [Candidatus Eremiobacteraeota bacterium]|nr:NAD-dependent malic enzyme [Candidatus Eremiobacteraeota bacterium]